MRSNRSSRALSFAVALVVGSALPAAQSTKLNRPLPSPGSDVLEFAPDPGGAVAYYVADQDQAGIFELYRVPVDLSATAVRLSAPMPAFGDVASGTGEPSFLVAPTGRVVYRADPVVNSAFEPCSIARRR